MGNRRQSVKGDSPRQRFEAVVPQSSDDGTRYRTAGERVDSASAAARGPHSQNASKQHGTSTRNPICHDVAATRVPNSEVLSITVTVITVFSSASAVPMRDGAASSATA